VCNPVRCFLPEDRFFLSDAKFLCHALFLSALHSQSHSLRLLASLHPVTLLLVFQGFHSLKPSVIRSRVLWHAQSNFSAAFSKFPARSEEGVCNRMSKWMILNDAGKKTKRVNCPRGVTLPYLTSCTASQFFLPVPYYNAWWLRHMYVNNLPRVIIW